jgi:hypothetical protein
MAERIFGGSDVDVPEEWESFNISVLVHCVVCHVHVPLTNCLALDVAEVDSLFLGIVLYDLDNGKAVNGEVSICAFPTVRAAGDELYKSIPMPGSCEH